MNQNLALLTNLITISLMRLQAVEISWIIQRKLFGNGTRLPHVNQYN